MKPARPHWSDENSEVYFALNWISWSTVVQRATPRSLARSPTWGLKIPETNLQSIPRYQGKQISSAKKRLDHRGAHWPRAQAPTPQRTWGAQTGRRKRQGGLAIKVLGSRQALSIQKPPADKPTTNAARIQLLSQPAQKPRAALAGPSFCELAPSSARAVQSLAAPRSYGQGWRCPRLLPRARRPTSSKRTANTAVGIELSCASPRLFPRAGSSPHSICTW